MMIEIGIIGLLLVVILFVQGKIDGNKFIKDNEKIFKLLREDDYNFLVAAKYGDGVNPDVLFEKRVKDGLLVLVLLVVIFIANLNFLSLIICFIISYIVFKNGYSKLKSYYKKHLHEIDMLLPYYLKSLEILIQHYTVPVAIGKSMEDAPEIFRDGLKNLINEINAGNDTIEPYMEFARQYPVRDSMRMMRLLYRLSLGRQERKQEQLLAFSKTISNLQQKARETKYKNRLDKMEGKTMSMLITTGLGVMVLLILAVIMLMGI